MKTKIADIKIGQPAIRALQSIGIEYLEQLSDYNEKDLLALHGFGKKGLLILQNAMALKGLALKRKENHMSKIIAGMTMSLDGFISDEYGNINCLYEDLEALRDAPYMQEAIDETGAVIMGKRTYELGDPTLYADHYEFQVPIFIVTHHIPDVLPKQNDLLTFTFVTDGLLSAVNQAKAAAKDKAVQVVGGVDVINQLLKAGFVDELTMDIMPIFLGKGKRLFTDETLEGIKLEKTKCSEEGQRTTLRFKVL